jgi:hypothetical protein
MEAVSRVERAGAATGKGTSGSRNSPGRVLSSSELDSEVLDALDNWLSGGDFPVGFLRTNLKSSTMPVWRTEACHGGRKHPWPALSIYGESERGQCQQTGAAGAWAGIRAANYVLCTKAKVSSFQKTALSTWKFPMR